MNPPQAAVTVDCFVRASSPVEPVERVVETLREYDRSGVIDDLEIRAWPDEALLSDVTEGSDAVVRYRLFRAWADENDVHLGPSFARSERATLVDEAETVIVLPVVCLAIHVDGELTDVVPHRTGTTTYTVDDALADLSDRAGSPAPDGRTPDRCPSCGGTLVTGQGPYDCPACSWTADAEAGDRRDDPGESGGSETSRVEDIDRQRPP